LSINHADPRNFATPNVRIPTPTRWRRNPDQRKRSKSVQPARFHFKCHFPHAFNTAHELVSHTESLSKPNRFFTHARDARHKLSFEGLIALHAGNRNSGSRRLKEFTLQKKLAKIADEKENLKHLA